MLLRYTIKRLLLMIPLILGISVLTLGILHLTPGDPVMTETAMNPDVSPDAVIKMRELYGLNDPFHIQYINWLGRLLRFDLGVSFIDNQPVLNKVAAAMPATLILQGFSLFLVFGLGIPLGVFSAAKKGTRLERGLTGFSFFAYSFPFFWLALLVQMFFGVWLGLFPVSGFQSIRFSEPSFLSHVTDVAWHLVLPLFVTTFGAWAAISRYMRNSMLEVMSQDYIRTARAKGLSEALVMRRHAFPNAVLPIITLVGLSLPALLGGSFIIESIFSWPGMGYLGYKAAISYDYPVVMGTVFMSAVLTVLGNLAADISYAFFDPRIRY